MHLSLLLALAAAGTARLLTALPSAPVMAAGELARRAAAADPNRLIGPATSAPAGVDSSPTLIPDPAGLIDLAGKLTADQQSADQERPINPFRLRYHAPIAARTVAVAIGGVIRTDTASQDCCVLNGQILRSGETFEGLTLSSISEAQVTLAAARCHLLLPADGRTIHLRLPQ